MPDPSRPHFPGLNGLRALAALAVLVSHLGIWMGRFGLPVQPRFQPADFAVTVFFALSGFLITHLLLQEREQRQIDVRKFYLRRILRIWPLYYTYLAIVVVHTFITTPGVLPGSLGYYVLLVPNLIHFLGHQLPNLGHYWSLGVEEQFYLFWPWLLRSSRQPLRTIACFTAAYIGLRLVCHLAPGWLSAYHYLASTRFDCMGIGGIGAVLFHQRNSWFLRAVSHWGTSALAWGVLGLVAVGRFHVPGITHDVVAAATVCIIVAQIQQTHRIIRLDHPTAEFLGSISYGIYVWHPFVIQLCGSLLRQLSVPTPAKYGLAYGSVFGLTLLIAYASHRWLERPFLAWRERHSATPLSVVPHLP